MRKIKAQVPGRVPELSELIKASENTKYHAIKDAKESTSKMGDVQKSKMASRWSPAGRDWSEMTGAHPGVDWNRC